MRWQDELRQKIERLTLSDFVGFPRQAEVVVEVPWDTLKNWLPHVRCVNSRPFAGVRAHGLMLQSIMRSPESCEATFSVASQVHLSRLTVLLPRRDSIVYNLMDEIDFNEL